MTSVRFSKVLSRFLTAILLTGLCACSALEDLTRSIVPEELTEVKVVTADAEYIGKVPSDLTVKEALKSLGIPFSADDRITPGLSVPADEAPEIRIVRVTYEEETVEKTLPFESRTVRNESLPDGDLYIVQEGKNGLQRVTTRTTFEDGEIIGKSTVSAVTLQAARPEILMVGARAEYSPIHIPGKLIYIANGNAWLMEESTENRTPLITTGDLDGRILDLSSNGRYILFSRTGSGVELNSLWMADLERPGTDPISLRVENVIHFAAWLPGDALRFVYSTVEPSEEAPGWKANNDLHMRVVSESGMLMSDDTILEADSDGTYSWWGTEFRVSADGKQLLYAAPDEIGIIDRMSGDKRKIADVLPYERIRSDWAWIPTVNWTADNDGFIFSYHGDISGNTVSFDPTAFHIGSYSVENRESSTMLENTGLFSYPVTSPRFSDGSADIAYLETLLPLQTEAERYRIMVAGEHGEDPRAVYPLEGSSGYVTPQQIVWAPETDRNSTWLAFLDGGNLRLVNPFTGIYNQITSDGSITRFIWE